MDYADVGLEAITEHHALHAAFDRAGVTYVDGVPQHETDWTGVFAVGGIIALACLIIYGSEKQRIERQKYMTPCERSMDDCMHAMASRPYYGGGYGYGYREPLFEINL